jgi:hypothetical protein
VLKVRAGGEVASLAPACLHIILANSPQVIDFQPEFFLKSLQFFGFASV